MRFGQLLESNDKRGQLVAALSRALTAARVLPENPSSDNLAGIDSQLEQAHELLGQIGESGGGDSLGSQIRGARPGFGRTPMSIGPMVIGPEQVGGA